MGLRRHSVVFVTATFVAGATLSAQRAFKSGIDIVPLTVTVTDRAGKFVPGLTGSDFTVYEDGVPQPLSFFASGDVPVDVGIVLDTSASMATDLSLVRTAATGLVRALGADDRAAVVEIKERASIPHTFTTDRTAIEQAIRGIAASGSTALYDGLYVVLREFERERQRQPHIRRQALVLLSDGLDTQSRLAFEDVLDLTRRANVSIYVVALRGSSAMRERSDQPASVLRAEYDLTAVARDSGGRLFLPKHAGELPVIYRAIAQELASQYELGYTPARPAGDGGFRRVAVQVTPTQKALARTRTGYYPSGDLATAFDRAR